MTGGSRLPRLLLAAGVLVGAYLRLRDVAGAFLFGDEFHSLRHLRLGFAAAAATFEPNGSGLALPLLQGALAALLGLGHWSLRLPAAAGSIAALLLVHPAVRRTVGAPAALAATLLVAVNGLHVFYGHFGRAYALAAALTLVLLWACTRILDARPRGGDYAWVALAAALLPWAHLAATAVVAGVLGGTALALLVDPARRRRVLGLAAAALAGAAGATALYAPAWESTMAFVRRKTEEEQYYGRFGVGDVLVLVAGHWTLAVALVAAAALGALVLLRRRRADALPLLCAAAVPWIALWTTRPFGDPYAYARYVLPGVAPLLAIAGAGITAVATRLAPARADAAAPLAAGLAAALVLLRGPLGLAHRADGPYANVYLGMLPLPAFDAPAPDTPAFYRTLAAAGPVTIIEAPALMNRSRHLYRNYYLQHGRRTLLGFLPEELADPPEGPYVAMDAPPASLAARADYLVLHRDAAAEAARYWQFVFDPARGGGAPGERAVMERQRQYGGIARPQPDLVARLERELGGPTYVDRDLLVWKLGAR